MIRKFKMLGIVVAAVLALSAVGAASASATNFTASSYPTAATATASIGNDDWKTEAGSIECHVHLHFAAIASLVPKLTITPTFSNCKGFGFLSGTVSMEGCDFYVNVLGRWGIKCPFGKWIRQIFGTCEVQIGEQEELNKVDLANSGSGISTQATVTGIAYTVTKDGFGCPFAGTGAKSGATYTQNNPILISSTNGATIDIG